MPDPIAAIYAQIPRLNCQRKCQACCGPILCSAKEWDRMQTRSLVPLTVNDGMTCSALVNGGCAVYADRPLICRLYGVVRAMACPYGCEPERWMTDAEASRLLREMGRLSKGEIAGPVMVLIERSQR